ncbi:A-kinase anchor protein 13 isoform X2 [Ambystoma mexicanum]|uniref:A-kinase anchor protein 13 isoform X2 n=1 Tax=Ambystoma mexicanum TaxID=8296 RepID=UPI0037E90847
MLSSALLRAHRHTDQLGADPIAFGSSECFIHSSPFAACSTALQLPEMASMVAMDANTTKKPAAITAAGPSAHLLPSSACLSPPALNGGGEGREAKPSREGREERPPMLLSALFCSSAACPESRPHLGVLWVMKLNPQQGPLYGDSVLTVLLTEDVELEEDVVFYLQFAGSTLKHLTSTKKVDSVTLKTITPGHDCCETVKVSLCASKKGSNLVVAEETFQFVQDEAYDAAQFLAASAGNQQALIFTRFLERSRPPSGDASVLDEKITLAFRHLTLPEEWNVLGTGKNINEDVPQETLMHFAVRLGLVRLAWFLLQQPGGRDSLSVQNNEGTTPISLAQERGFQRLHQLLTDEPASEPDSWSSVSRVIHSGDEVCVKHHRGLQLYTLTERLQGGPRGGLEGRIGELRKHILSHSQRTNATMQSQPEPETMEPASLSELLTQELFTVTPETEAPSSNDSVVCCSIPNVEMLSEESRPEGDTDTEAVDSVESNASDCDLRAGGEKIAEPSYESTSEGFGTEKEAERQASSVIPTTSSDNCSCAESPPIGVDCVEILPSSGPTSAEAGMTSTAIVLNQESLCEGDNYFQEVKPTRDVAVAEESGSQGHSFQDLASSMGQTVCSNKAEVVDSGHTQDFMASGEQDLIPTEDGLPELCSCQANAMPTSATVIPLDLPGGASAGELSGTGDRPQEQDPSACDLPCQIISCDAVSGAGDLTSGTPHAGSLDGEQSPLMSDVKSTDGETTETCASAIVVAEHSPSGEQVEPANHDSESKVDLDGRVLSTAAQCDTPHENDTTIPAVDAVSNSSQHTEESLPGSEMASGSKAEGSSAAAPAEQEGGKGHTKDQASGNESPAPRVCEANSAPDSSAQGLEPDSVQPKAPTEPVQKQAELCAPEPNTEQQLSRLSSETSATEQEQKEVAQETDLSLVSFLKEGEQMTNAERHLLAPPSGDVAPLQRASEEAAAEHVQRDNPIDTPYMDSINARAENQEVELPASVPPEQTNVILEHALSAACQEEKDLRGNSAAVQQAVDNNANPCQVLCDSGELASKTVPSASAGLDSGLSTEGKKDPDMESNLYPATGLMTGVSCPETSSDKVWDAKDGDLLALPLEDLQAARDDGTLIASLQHECEPSQSQEVISLHAAVPESTVLPIDCQKLSEGPAQVSVMDNAEEVEESEDSANVILSRASLQPIAEEPLSDMDSSQDTTSTSSEAEHSPKVKEFGNDLLELEGDVNDIDKPVDANLPHDAPSSKHCVAYQENTSLIHFVKELAGSVETEDSVYTTSALADEELEAPLDCSESCNAASTEDFSSLAEEIKSTDLSESIPLEVPIDLAHKGEADSGLELSELMEEDFTSTGVAETEPPSDGMDLKCEDEVDFAAGLQTSSAIEDSINRESWCSIEPCPIPQLGETKQTNDSTECESFLEDGLGSESTSSQGIYQRESGSDSDIFHLSGEGMDDMVFTKTEEEQSPCDITSSSSSTEDTTSLERTSSRGSDISLPRTFHVKKHKSRHSLDSSCSSTATAAAEGHENGDAEPAEIDGEEMDSITEVPAPASLSRNSMRSLSPFRRHSWGPGKNQSADSEINQRSSLRILGDVVRKSPSHRRSYSLEGLVGDGEDKSLLQTSEAVSIGCKVLTQSPLASRGDCSSVVYLNKGDRDANQSEIRGSDRLERPRLQTRGFSYSTSALSPPLTKSMSLVTIHQPGLETQGRTRPKRRISFSFNIPPLVPKSKNVYSFGSSSSDEESDSTRSMNSTSSSLAQSISEESCNQLPPSPSRKDLEGKGGTKVSRTFSYIKNKMSSKKTKEKEKDKDKTKDKEKESKEKEKDKKTLNGHHFTTTPIVGPMNCYNCIKVVTCKDAYLCSYCNSIVHKGCRESYASCAMVKMKQQKVLQAQDTSSLPTVVMRSKTALCNSEDFHIADSQPKERPRSAIVAPDENTLSMLMSNRRPQTSLSLSKSVSIQNIAGAGIDENHLTTSRYISRSTDSLNKFNSKVTESMESLNDEGTDMNEGQLMGDFEIDSKQLEAESWSQVVDSKFMKQHKKDVVKRQDVIYELMQTEMHHVRTLKIMSDVYSRGMMTELQFEQHMVDKIFPCLDDLLKIHNQFFQHILDRKKESMVESSDKNFVIRRIGDILVNQFSGENAERMKKIYGKFCGHHNEAVNYFKDLLAKDKRFQVFMKKKMSSTVVRRLGIQECILLVTQRITKYPVLLQRILQYTRENEVEHEDLARSLVLVKDVITAVNSKVNNYEKKMRLHEIYSKTDSKSIQRMKGGKMFAKQDLTRRKLIRDGPVLLKTAAGRLKEVQAVLLSDTLVFLQEKDQKYVFASLEQRSTVVSLKRLIVRDVAHEERGLFLISMGEKEKDPEMVEVHTSSKEERNSWIQVIQDTMNTMGKDEDEGIPSESEEERKMLDTKFKELKEQLQQKDKQILVLLNEKESIFRSLCNGQDDGAQDLISRALFRASSELKGEDIVKTAIKEVESLQGIVSSNLGSPHGLQSSSPTELGVAGPVSLPRRAETFGGFDSHQMTTLKNGDKDEVEDNQDLRRTESDSVLKKGGNANFMILLKRNSEQVLSSVSHLHELLSTLQAVVMQQDTYIEDQKLVLNEKTISRTLSKPNSLIEQEKQRSLEKQRQELANLQKQQAQHLDEKRKREREWDAREKELAERESRLAQKEEQAHKGLQELEKEKEDLQAKKEEYQRDLERLRAAQKQLEKETEQLKRDMEQDSHQLDKNARTSSMNADSSKQPSASSPKSDHLEPVSPKKDSLFRTDSKQKGKGPFHLLSTTNQTNKPTDRLFNLSKPKEKKEKKKKSKGGRSEATECLSPETPQESEEIFC